MKKIFSTAFLLILLIFVFFSSVSAQFDDIQKDEVNLDGIASVTPFSSNDIGGERIRSFKANIAINKDGTISIKENISYDFGPLYKHGIYRDVPVLKTNSDGKKFQLTFSDFTVADENNRPYQYETLKENDNLRLKIGDANRTITGIHNYVISYQVAGALTYFSDHDELYWNVTGNGWEVPINHTTAEIFISGAELGLNRVTSSCYTGYLGESNKLCGSSVESDRVVFETGILSANQGLTIVVGFPKNIVAVLEPKQFVPFFETWLGKLVSFLLSLVGFIWYIGLPLYIIFRWKHFGRDPKGTVGVTSAWFDPPKLSTGKRFLTPGEVGTLGDETADLKDVSATIVDLARRGYLIIDERKKGDFYLIKKKNIDAKLLTFEQKLINGFFGSKKEIRIKDEELYQEVEDVKNNLYEQTVSDGLFPKNPKIIRDKYYILAGIGLFTGNIFLAIVAFIFGRVMPRKTVEGVDAFNVAKSLKNFLTSQDRQLKFQAEKQLMFERLLPYAIAFGVEKVWAKRFKDIGIQPPSWYRSYSTANFSSWVFVNSLNSSMKTVASAATPTRSSSGFSSGFSGGGFSGGGGGGGGGGSW
jgi:hypothetical protein